MSETLQGVVKWFNNAKGFGFIEHESGKDVFVHYSVIEQSGYKSLKDGEVVNYEIKEGPKGFHATRVSCVESEQEDSENAQALTGEPVSYETPAITGESDQAGESESEDNEEAETDTVASDSQASDSQNEVASVAG